MLKILEDPGKYPEIIEDSWNSLKWVGAVQEKGQEGQAICRMMQKEQKIRERQISNMVEMNKETG